MNYRIVLLSALGYFVDILDLFLFNVLRVPSLKELGVPSNELIAVGAKILNWQMGGLLLGSLVWGALGDIRGRVKTLYGSIAIYSLATLANCFVHSVDAYVWCRFIAGFGLAGELGVAVTLVCESMDRDRRGLGTMWVAGIGLSGGVAASLLAELLPWRTCYAVGAAMGFALLLLRVQMPETELFSRLQASGKVGMSNLRALFSWRWMGTLFRWVLVGTPIYFVSGILMVFAPEIAKALNMRGEVLASRSVLFSYIGFALGDVLSGALSQKLDSRRQAIAFSLVLLSGGIVWYLLLNESTPAKFYTVCFVCGLTAGYWAVLITATAESFPTALRATATTVMPNLVRAALIPMTLTFQYLHPQLGIVASSALIGGFTIIAASIALTFSEETFHVDLETVG